MSILGWHSPDFECHFIDDMIRGPTKLQKALHSSAKVKKLASHAGSSVGTFCPNSHCASPGPGSSLRYGLRCGNINNHVIRQWRGSQICDDDIINPPMACHGETFMIYDDYARSARFSFIIVPLLLCIASLPFLVWSEEHRWSRHSCLAGIGWDEWEGS
jgi:hypothetical protein